MGTLPTDIARWAPNLPGDGSPSTPKGLWGLFVTVWVSSCAAGIAVTVLLGQPLIGMLIAGVPTLIGVVVNPVFALCCIALMLPLGGALVYQEVLSANRVVGGVAALGILMHCLVTGRGIRIKGSPMIPLFLIVAWSITSILWAPARILALAKVFTLIQLAGWGLAIWNVLAYERSPIWPLRCYVLGMVAAIAQGLLTGSLGRMVHAGERVTIAVEAGGALNPNVFGGLLGIAFIVSIYLITRDPAKWMRLMWLGCTLVFPIMLIQAGSRGSLVAVAAAIGVSLLSFRAILRSKAVLLVLGLALMTLIVGIGWGVYGGFASEASIERLTSSSEIGDAFRDRLQLVRGGIETALARPFLGTGIGNYLEVMALHQAIAHADLVNLAAELGLPGLFLYVWFLCKLAIAVAKSEAPLEKWLSRSLIVFLLVSALKGAIFFNKFFWFFAIVGAAIAYRSRHAQDAAARAAVIPQ